MKKTIIAAFAAAAAMVGLAGAASAQTYPSGTIQFVVPFPAGGGTDFASRILTERIGQDLGWRLVIDNRPGAGGNLGLAQVARATADGALIGMGQTSNLSINPTLYADIPYDALNDFTPIALVSTQPMVIAVAPGSPIQDLAGLVETARKNPEGLTMSTPGTGTVSHLAMELFAQANDISFVHIPYPGASQAVTDAMGGHVDFAATSLPSALTQIRSGALRAIAVTSLERNDNLPDVPTIAESGYEGFDVGDWKAVVGPAGLSDEVVEAWNAAINAALENEGLSDAIRTEGSVPLGGSPEEFREFMEAEYQRWSQIVEETGATRD